MALCTYVSKFALTLFCCVRDVRVVVRHPQLRQPGNYFIVSLACSDLLLSFIYPVYNLAHLEMQQIQDVLGQPTTTFVLIIIIIINVHSSLAKNRIVVFSPITNVFALSTTPI